MGQKRRKSFIWCNYGKLPWGRVLRACPTLFLDKIASLIGTKNVGLDRDDGLIHQANGPKSNMKRKDIIALFKSEGLSITIDTNLIETDLLDVSFNLEMDKFFPFREPSNNPLYIHSSQTIHLPSSNYCHRWPTNVFQICQAMNMNSRELRLFTNQLWKAVVLTTVSNSKHLLKTQDETEIGKSFG